MQGRTPVKLESISDSRHAQYRCEPIEGFGQGFRVRSHDDELCPTQDDEGREVAIKIDRLDSKKFSAETATKSYIEVSGKAHLGQLCLLHKHS